MTSPSPPSYLGSRSRAIGALKKSSGSLDSLARVVMENNFHHSPHATKILVITGGGENLSSGPAAVISALNAGGYHGIFIFKWFS
jgi:hypothetical protein